MLIGLLLGSLAGYYGGLVDEIIMRLVDIFMSIPTLILAMAIVTALGHSLRVILLDRLDAVNKTRARRRRNGLPI